MLPTKQFTASLDVNLARSFWKEIEGFYAKTTNFESLSTQSIIRAMIDEANISKESKVLDAGCGNLRITAGLYKYYCDLNVEGVDLTQELLDKGLRYFKSKQLSMPKVYCADLASLPMNDNCYDVVVSSRVFQYISDPIIALKELKRVLKPGGRLVITVPNRLNPINRIKYQGRLHSPAEIESWLIKSGFMNTKRGSVCFAPSFFNLKWNSIFKVLEFIGRIPLIGMIGGNAFASGQK